MTAIGKTYPAPSKIYSETYPWDIDLIQELGLKTFKITRDKNGHGHSRWVFLGRHVPDDESGYVRVWVKSLPSQCFKFEINLSNKNQKIVLETGTGSFCEYWEKVKPIVSDWVVIKSYFSGGKRKTKWKNQAI